ncbi:acyl-CoA thioesterase [Desulfovibrio sp. Huiquan2017]|uniref:acyl-CoA thioesterase n=1 Tax=Desulfovibrio sp. Huiquan2017 TaxID=2816861 RepID=UPI001A92F1CA|nr:acyl-CoA thioesterase [Desulfovibrio sp. Huiquan2017]
MSRNAYFKAVKDAPAPLRDEVERRVRFEEVDPLGIVWHGRYPSYFEDGRVSHGHRYGIGYLDFHAHRVTAPVKQMHVDYILPLAFGDTVRIETLLHYNEAARLNYEFIIRNAAGEVTTTGYTVQLFVDAERELMLTPPDFYTAFLAQWSGGQL